MPTALGTNTRVTHFHDRNRPFDMFGAAKRQAEETGGPTTIVEAPSATYVIIRCEEESE